MYKPFFSENQSKMKVNLCDTSMCIDKHSIALIYKLCVLTDFLNSDGIIRDLYVPGKIHSIGGLHLAADGWYFSTTHLSIAINDPIIKTIWCECLIQSMICR